MDSQKQETQARLPLLDAMVKRSGNNEMAINIDRLFFALKDKGATTRLQAAAKFLSKAQISQDEAITAEWMDVLKAQIRESVDRAKKTR